MSSCVIQKVTWKEALLSSVHLVNLVTEEYVKVQLCFNFRFLTLFGMTNIFGNRRFDNVKDKKTIEILRSITCRSE